MSENNGCAVNLKNIHFSYSSHEIFSGLDLSLSYGEKAGLVGANGVGKTTLLRLIIGLENPSFGDIEIFGKKMQDENDFSGVRLRMGYLFQDSDDQLFCPTVIDDVCFGLLNMGHNEDVARDMAMKSLTELGIERLAEKITYKLSGGEKRLVAFATIYAMKPELYLLDEPSAGLDKDAEDMLADFIAKNCSTVFIVSHNEKFMERIVTSFRCIKDKVLTV